MPTLAAWRITRLEFVGAAFTGEGASRYPGRWNPAGAPMVYTAGSLSLAVLEILAHLDDTAALARYVAIPVEFAADWCETLPRHRLPADWRRQPVPESTRGVGADWLRAGRRAVLAVPSVVIPQESNYLLNPSHAQFGGIRIGAPQPLPFDPRLLPR
ncbi:MAG: RES family NAD+ phosphorylase [Lentisphaeria bacterium]|jgi:RES domain-containing protein